MKIIVALFFALFFSLVASSQTLPSITTQPQNLTVNPSSAASLSVVATGTGILSYRWFKGSSALADSGGLTGSTTPTLSFASAQTSDSGSYSVIVSNSGGSVTSNSVTLTVALVSAPIITSATSLTTPPDARMIYNIIATNSTATYGATGLPSGLTVNTTTGVISGSPSPRGVYSVVLSATNVIGTGTATLTLTVVSELPLVPSYQPFTYADKWIVPATGSSPVVAGRLSSPSNLAVDASGNIFVADAGSHIVAKVAPDGTLSTIAGTAGQGGSADGGGLAASFLSPGGIAVDGSGNLYVADTGNHTIRKIAPSGIVSTLAGSVGQAGSADGTGAAARFFSPLGIASDASGTLYVADTVNHTIRKITPAGVVSTLAGSPGLTGNADGSGSTARFNLPNSLALDSAGVIYVADGGNNAVRKISPSGMVITVAGTFNQPSGIALDSAGNVFISDTNNNAIRELTPDGALSTLTLKAAYVLPSTPELQMLPSVIIIVGPKGMACDLAGNFYWINGNNSSSAPTPIYHENTIGLHKAVPFPATTIRIISPPLGDSVVSGSVVRLRVVAEGQDLHYAWYGQKYDRNGSRNFGYLGSLSIQDVTAQLGQDTTYHYLTNAGTYGVYAYNAAGGVNVSVQISIFPKPPVVTSQPTSQTVVVGQPAIFSITTVSNPGNPYTGLGTVNIIYAWSFNGTPILDSNSSTLTITTAQAANAGNYSVTVTQTDFLTGTNSVTSATAVLTVNPPNAPQLLTFPQSLTIKAGATATFSASASGSPNPTYQWSFNGNVISGATAAAYSIPIAQSVNAGRYQVTATNSSGNVTSDVATLVVITAPAITSSPQAKAVYAGNSVTLSVSASGLSVTYQWLLNGVPITGATNATLALSNAQPANAGNYTVVISNLAGSVTSDPAAVDVVTTRLVNLSARAAVGGGNLLSVGFVTTGTTPKTLLVRGIGPTLGALGVSGSLPATQLTLFDATRAIIDSNTAWGGTTLLKDAFTQVGAFALPAGSADAAILKSLPGGAYTAQHGGLNGTAGVGLAEIYDADPGYPTSRLVNLSALGFVGTGGDVLIAGFVISGNRPAQILLRAIGPALDYFGVPGTLSKPLLTLVNGSSVPIGASTAWNGDPALSAAFARVGAFALPAASNDAALLVTLAPGSYTVLVSGVANATGTALVEIYEVPQ
jgi:sugar lactone lactonase YvrE